MWKKHEQMIVKENEEKTMSKVNYGEVLVWVWERWIF